MNKTSTHYAIVAAKLKKRFAPITDESLDAFLAICTYKVVKNRQAILGTPENNSSCFFFYIVEGLVRGFKKNNDGEDVNVFIKPEGTFTGAPDELFGKRGGNYKFESILETEVLMFNLEEFENLAFDCRDIYNIYLYGMKENVSTLISRIESLTQKQPEERYLDLKKKHPLFFKKAFNKHIASYLGITPVSLSRIMKRIKDNKQRA